jgi:ApbE superfamily uncharacterized protein (UPF0280 family)
MGIRIGAATATIYLSLGSLTSAGTCPSAVTAAVHKAHADAAVTSCKQEHEKGKSEFEVKLATAGGQTMDLDVSPDGTILLTEEPVALSAVPAEVMNALGSKYAGAKPTRAEKQTAADGTVTYEIAFAAGMKKKEATFGADGTFVEEE